VRFLAVDPAAAGRIEEMTINTCDRIHEARERGCLGELSRRCADEQPS
jgi:hypothetical protein